MNEFEVIANFFKQQNLNRDDVLLEIGDDAAIVSIPANNSLAISVDTLIEGVHFPIDTTPFDIGYKALAVNLSDLAAMGADPAWFTLALSLPKVNEAWLKKFCEGLFSIANEYHIKLIGGDTTKGSLSITIQTHGFVPEKKFITRKGAKVGDKIYVSGTLGDAGLGLKILSDKNAKLSDDDKEFVLQRLNRPSPRIELGKILRNFASSAIDISDGLLADLKHILDQSKVGAHIDANKLPLSGVLKKISKKDALKLALTAGDDYELCFTIPADLEGEFLAEIKNKNFRCTKIGEIEKDFKLTGFDLDLQQTGFKHF